MTTRLTLRDRWTFELVVLPQGEATAPRFLTIPTIRHGGSPQLGEVLTGVNGTATAPIGAVAWLLAGTSTAVATTATFSAGELAKSYEFENTATNSAGTTSARSAPVTIAPPPDTLLSPIDGRALLSPVDGRILLRRA
ncbi:hypothetical protein GGQ80_000777 [Sphingomonas jinjuensis]|uniref:Uncharacterized protein n=1 Tax=Sphingomonas jinjuensis TaxID=535907 RepID=A0A840F517_9SPHN|nr:hypothetical protein [Sphingomonas jinjuensis]MBB4152889.1 hypothetical protein [Sphingomonas jinjuensis]